jgi:antitoxin ParD1/3/4
LLKIVIQTIIVRARKQELAVNVSLTPELERLVAAKVKSGMYGSSSEVIRAALRALHQWEADQAARLEALRRAVRIGVEQAHRGELVDGEKAFDAVVNTRPSKYRSEPAAKNRARRRRRATR